jgi:hypothetical protein
VGLGFLAEIDRMLSQALTELEEYLAQLFGRGGPA